MSATLLETPFDLTTAVKNLITEDDEPVDNILSEKQQRLLVDALYESWTPLPEGEPEEAETTEAKQTRSFWAAAKVGIFSSVYTPGIAPDVFISLDVAAPSDLTATRSYFMWEYGKAPEAVLEIVSNRKGKELEGKRKDYAKMGAIYYVVYDPFGALEKELEGDRIRVYEVGFGKRFRRRDDHQLPELGLSLTLWTGFFEGINGEWLRWCDAAGNLLLTGHERALQADVRAAQAEERAGKLAAKLRELGIDPAQL